MSHARVALVANPKSGSFDYFVKAGEAVAPSLGVEIVPTPVENAADIERSIASFARTPDGGLALPPDVTTITHRDLVIALFLDHLNAQITATDTLRGGGQPSDGSRQPLGKPHAQ